MSKRSRRSRSMPPARIVPKEPAQIPEHCPPVVFQIRIKGHIDERWIEWFENLTITLEETGNTLLTVPVVDQAALHGLLRKLRDLGVSLVSINPAGPDLPGNSPKEEAR